MSAIFYKNLPYGAGGSNVEANFSGSATDDLTKIGIDGTVYDITDVDAVHSSDKGVANGVASLDATGRVPSTQLPSYVDDVLEYASQSAFPATGESGKIYIALDTNKTYRWSGSAYVEISESLALGTTHSTAAYGDDAVSTAEPSFSEASTRTNLAGSGEKLSVILGKIKKWFTDLKDLAFIGKDGNNSKKLLRGDGTWTDDLEGKNVIDDLTMTNSTNDSGIVIKAPAQDMSGLYLRINFPNHMMDDGNLCSHGYLSYVLGDYETNGFGSLAGVNKDGTTSTKYLRGDGTWQTFPTIPTVNNKTLTIQKNGTQVAQFTANSASDVTANITVPTGDLASVNKPSSGQTTSYLRGDGTWQNFPTIPAAQVQSDWNQTDSAQVDFIKNKPDIDLEGSKTATGNPITLTDASESYAEELEITLEPIQDLHGYDKPWVGGAGKNKLPLTVAGIKAINTSGTWSGNAYTKNNVVFTLYTDNGGNITAINMNGTANADVTFFIPFDKGYGNVIANVGFTTTGSDSTFTAAICVSGGNAFVGRVRSMYSDADSSVFNLDSESSTYYFVLGVKSGYNASNIKAYPMIRLSTVTDATFAPYSNICPITGYTDVNVTTADASTSPTVECTITTPLGRTVYGGKLNVRTGVMTIDKGYKDLGDLSWTYTSNRFYTDISDMLRPNGIVCSHYALSASESIEYMADGTMWNKYWAFSQNNFVVNDSRYTSAASFKTAVSGVQLVYTLKEPITTQLTPAELKLLKEQNTVTTNGTTISLKYQPDNPLGDILQSAEEYTDRAIAKDRDEWLTVKDSSNVISVFHNITITGSVSWTRTLISKLSDYRFMYIEVTNTDYNFLALNEIVLVDTLLSGIYYNKQFSIYGDDGTITVYLYGSGQIVIGASVPSSVNSVKVSIKLIA